MSSMAAELSSRQSSPSRDQTLRSTTSLGLDNLFNTHSSKLTFPFTQQEILVSHTALCVWKLCKSFPGVEAPIEFYLGFTYRLLDSLEPRALNKDHDLQWPTFLISRPAVVVSGVT